MNRALRLLPGEPRLALALAASAPLLVVVGDAAQGVALGVVAALALCASGLLISLCHLWVPASMRFALLLIVAAGGVSASALALAAVAWDTYQVLQPALPFLLFNSLAFACLEQDCLGMRPVRAMGRVLRQAAGILILYSCYGALVGALLPGAPSAPGVLFILAASMVLFRCLPLSGGAEAGREADVSKDPP